MKNVLSRVAIAACVAFSGVAVAGVSLTPQQVAAQSVSQGIVKISIEGKKVINATVQIKGKTLYFDAKTTATVLGAKYNYDSKKKVITYSKNVDGKNVTLKLTVGSKTMQVNGEKVELTSPATATKTKVYAPLVDVILNLSSDAFASEDQVIHTLNNGQFFGGEVETVSAFGPVLAVEGTEEDQYGTFIVDAMTGKKLNFIDGTDLSISPDGKSVAYVNEDGVLLVKDVLTNVETALTDVGDGKEDLQWSPDSKVIYYLTGSKLEKITSLTVADKTVKTLNSDTLSFKQNLSVSSNGKLISFIYAKDAKITENPDTKEVDKVDTTGTEPQVYVLN
ncbi:MAG: stalk domain-containing protein, partial [Bacilli bacterium]